MLNTHFYFIFSYLYLIPSNNSFYSVIVLHLSLYFHSSLEQCLGQKLPSGLILYCVIDTYCDVNVNVKTCYR